MTTQSTTTETLQALLLKAGIDDFDLLLVGDGSGSKWGYAAGWASIAIEPDSLERKTFYGACNDATVNFAELMAYLAPLTWFVSRAKKERRRPRRGAFFEIHVITDSQYTETSGEREEFIKKTENIMLLAGYQTLGHKGFNVSWHWLERDTSDLNRLTDHLSRTARLSLTEANVPKAVEDRFGFTANTSNPWE